MRKSIEQRIKERDKKEKEQPKEEKEQVLFQGKCIEVE